MLRGFGSGATPLQHGRVGSLPRRKRSHAALAAICSLITLTLYTCNSLPDDTRNTRHPVTIINQENQP